MLAAGFAELGTEEKGWEVGVINAGVGASVEAADKSVGDAEGTDEAEETVGTTEAAVGAREEAVGAIILTVGEAERCVGAELGKLEVGDTVGEIVAKGSMEGAAVGDKVERGDAVALEELGNSLVGACVGT